MRASFFAITRAIASISIQFEWLRRLVWNDIPDRKIFVLQPFTIVDGRQRLFRSSNQIFVSLLLTIVCHFVQFLIELLKLCRFCHVVPEHKVRRLIWLVTLSPKEFQTIIDQGKIQEQPVAS